MAQTIHVKAGNPASRRVALWERSPDHPHGEVYVAGDRVVEVAVTQEGARRLANKTLVEVSGKEAKAATVPDAPQDAQTWPEGVTDEQQAALGAAGYNTLAAAQAASDDDLLTVAGIGAATVKRIRQG